MKPRRSRVRNPVVRILLIWMIETAALMLLSSIQAGMNIETAVSAMVAAAAIGLLNGLLWPLLSYIILPFAVLTLGLAALLMNATIILLISRLIEGFTIDSIGTAVLTALGLSVITTVVSSVLTIDDDGSWYRNVVKQRVRRIVRPEETDIPGIIFLEIDGLARPVLEKAMREGFAPNMKRWLDSGGYRLVEWETDLSSQTCASQAGILHGNNHNIPAFRWYDRRRRKVISSSNPGEIARVERELSDGNGLLANNGASRGNLLSGDATFVSVTASTLKDLSRLHLTDFYAYLISPYNFTRTLLLVVWDIILEKWQYWQARRKKIRPILDRQHRGGRYPFLRAFTTIIMRELNIYTLIGDMFSGVPVAYATFVGYDEVAHHSGVESYDALDILRKLDEQFARLERAARTTPRPYYLVVLSDHGQSGGETFKQRYGTDLQQLIQQYVADNRVQGIMQTREAVGHVNVLVSDALEHDVRSGRAIKRLAGSKVIGGEAHFGREEQVEELQEEAEILVLASGNLALVYGTRWARRATYEEIEQSFPGLLAGLASHEGIGWLMVKSEEHEAIVIGADGCCYLDSNRVEGANPLAGFGRNAVRHLRRYNTFPDAPDLCVNSFYDTETNEVAAFEEMIGCHGGLGGYQTRPFVLHPAGLKVEGQLVGAVAVYNQLKRWLAELHG
jgi:putative membrane protein